VGFRVEGPGFIGWARAPLRRRPTSP
jgi:hypothetical protein